MRFNVHVNQDRIPCDALGLAHVWRQRWAGHHVCTRCTVRRDA